MSKRVLIIGFVWPEPTSSAAGKRMLQLIQSFKNFDYEVTFATQAQESEFAFDLNKLSIDSFHIEVNNSSFDLFLNRIQPDIILFDRFIMEEQFGWRVAENCPNALRILDTEDLHFLRKERQQKINQSIEKELFSDIAKREIASIYRCDFTLIISEVEMQLLLQTYTVPAERLLYLPMWSEFVSQVNTFENRSNFMFIGNFMHEPNWDAVRYLKKEIWPLIRKQLPNTEIHIYGAYPSEKVYQITNEKEGFIIKGRAEDVNEICQMYRVMLAPLRFGAGVKGKFIDAMRNGLPSITTEIGAESMVSIDDWPGFVSDDIATLVSESIDLYQDTNRWKEMSERALKTHETNFTSNEWPSNFIKTIQNYRQKLDEIRERNFTGAMLMHHHSQGTKYMSKWIELKNKL
jgi:glycosyltransferase involved in cell wall biosynthesis